MGKSLWTKGLVIGIIILFLGASVVPNVTANYIKKEINEIEQVAVIKINADKHGNGGITLEIPLIKAEQIKSTIDEYLFAVQNDQISYQEYSEKVLSLLTDENILPKECTYENMMKIIEKMKNNIGDDNRNLEPLSRLLAYRYLKSVPSPVTIGLHAGIGTFLLGYGLGGGAWVTVFAVKPYIGSWVNIMNIFQGVNLSYYWSYVTAAVVLPNAPEHILLISAIAIPGLENARTLVLLDTAKALFGFYLVGAKISLNCVDYNRPIPATIFDLTIGLLGADVMIAV